MDASAVRRRLEVMGYITCEQQAEALAMSRPHVARILAGSRPVPPHMLRTVSLLEHVRPVILSARMRAALAQADPAGVLPPWTPFLPGVDAAEWDRIYDAMHSMGVITYTNGRARLTPLGVEALNHADDE